MLKLITLITPLYLLTLLSGCESTKEPLTGKRTDLLEAFSPLKKDIDAENINVTITESILNTEWTQGYYSSSNHVPHLDGGSFRNKVWSSSIGAGNTGSGFIVSAPVVQNEKIYALDSSGKVTALSTKSGNKIWSQKIDEIQSLDMTGGGLALGSGRLFVSYSSGHVAAFHSDTGQKLWVRKLPHALRSAPTYAKGRLYLITKNNRTFSLDSMTGRILWQQEATDCACTLIGGGKPAIKGSTVIVPYASGEIYAMRKENGFPQWAESLSSMKMFSSTSFVSQIKASPIIDNDMVFAISQNGRIVGMEFKTGNILWERELQSIATPVINGSFIYLVTNDHDVVCLVRDSGKIVWITPLPRASGNKPTTHAGPVLAGGKLLVTSSAGTAYFIKPETGEMAGSLSLDRGTYLPPVVAEKTAYFLLEDGTLAAYE